ncbi:glutathione S-transferase family protein [Pseudoduganella ginsengisoli]|uniref:Glutathione S-transferase family protein n=1 Tax=Pseudoduganella ginsengisoli TaxID=1462440 RepID=A0A6L6PVS8_9BURK|nr:glutathione S-transferase family protein [Pseudoduganella ginsengisoli]MTW01349.1 glutathione S-transferase family protein [Pseudoduganella ginsengisoli]
MRLYTHSISSNARRVNMVVAALNADVEVIEINLASEEDRRRLGEVNPNSKIPVLEDNGFVLWESCAIMQYLADKTAQQRGEPHSLYPWDIKVRADINRWMFWACQHFAPAIGVLTWERVWKGFVTGQPADPREVDRGCEELAQYATVLDGHLKDRQWLVGDHVTLADYAVAAPLMYRVKASLPVDQYPNMLAWFSRVQQLPAWQQTVDPSIQEPEPCA